MAYNNKYINVLFSAALKNIKQTNIQPINKPLQICSLFQQQIPFET